MPGDFTLDDFRRQVENMLKLGPTQKIMGTMPGMGGMQGAMDGADANVRRLLGTIDSMTPGEKQNPKQIDPGRQRRIAVGAGVEPHEVNELVKQFDSLAGIMERMAGKGFGGRM
jgi:signal recognition particle subunit SRP54